MVFLAEITHGMFSVCLARKLGMGEAMTGLAVICALTGTRWSIWIYGRGNTRADATLLMIAWPVMVIGLVVWIIGRILLRSSFKATRLWWISLPVSLLLATGSWLYALMGAALAFLALWINKID